MFVPITLDKTRNFRYGMKALAAIEQKLGKSLSKIDLDNLSVSETAVIMWAGLAHEDTELTPEKVMDLVDGYSTLGEALGAMQKAITLAFEPVAKTGGEKKAEKKQTAPTA